MAARTPKPTRAGRDNPEPVVRAREGGMSLVLLITWEPSAGASAYRVRVRIVIGEAVLPGTDIRPSVRVQSPHW